MRPESCACTGRKRDTHAFQHRYRICPADELTIVVQTLSGSGRALHRICLARGSGTTTDSRSRLKTHCLLINNICRHGWRPSDAGLRTSSLATTAQITPDIVTDVERTTKEFGWHM